MNRSLRRAMYFARSIWLEFTPSDPACRAFVAKQERGDASTLTSEQRQEFHQLEHGWQRASQQVITWIDEIVACQLNGMGFWDFLIEARTEPDPVIGPMMRGLAKSIRRDGLACFLARHPQILRHPRWQQYAFGR